MSLDLDVFLGSVTESKFETLALMGNAISLRTFEIKKTTVCSDPALRISRMYGELVDQSSGN